MPTALASALSSFKDGSFDSKALSIGLFSTVIATIASQGKDIRARWNSRKSNYYLELKGLVEKGSRYSVLDMNKLFNEYVND